MNRPTVNELNDEYSDIIKNNLDICYILVHHLPGDSLRCSVNERKLTVNGRFSTVICT